MVPCPSFFFYLWKPSLALAVRVLDAVTDEFSVPMTDSFFFVVVVVVFKQRTLYKLKDGSNKARSSGRRPVEAVTRVAWAERGREGHTRTHEAQSGHVHLGLKTHGKRPLTPCWCTGRNLAGFRCSPAVAVIYEFFPPHSPSHLFKKKRIIIITLLKAVAVFIFGTV